MLTQKHCLNAFDKVTCTCNLGQYWYSRTTQTFAGSGYINMLFYSVILICTVKNGVQPYLTCIFVLVYGTDVCKTFMTCTKGCNNRPEAHWSAGGCRTSSVAERLNSTMQRVGSHHAVSKDCEPKEFQFLIVGERTTTSKRKSMPMLLLTGCSQVPVRRSRRKIEDALQQPGLWKQYRLPYANYICAHTLVHWPRSP